MPFVFGQNPFQFALGEGRSAGLALPPNLVFSQSSSSERIRLDEFLPTGSGQHIRIFDLKILGIPIFLIQNVIPNEGLVEGSGNRTDRSVVSGFEENTGIGSEPQRSRDCEISSGELLDFRETLVYKPWSIISIQQRFHPFGKGFLILKDQISADRRGSPRNQIARHLRTKRDNEIQETQMGRQVNDWLSHETRPIGVQDKKE